VATVRNAFAYVFAGDGKFCNASAPLAVPTEAVGWTDSTPPSKAENRTLVQAFGINVPRMITLTYGFGVGLAAFAGVMAAPIYQVNPQMGANMIIVVFAVVVIGGMGSIVGAIVTGFGLGIVEGLTKVFYPEASATVIFVIMVIVLLLKPAGLFGKER